MAHYPHPSRALALAALIGGLFLLGPAAGRSEAAQCKGSAAPAFRTSDRAATKATLCLLNKQRAARGLHKLHADRKQARAAGRHNRLMVRSRCFSHACPGERDLVGRLASSGYLPCGCSWGVGENIAWGAGSTASPKRIVALWMSSPPHRANILTAGFREVGVAVDTGSPDSKDREASTYTTDFGFKR